MTPAELGPGDIVTSWGEVAEGAKEPLVVLDRLGRFLDAAGVGEGPPRLEPVGEGRSNVTLTVTRGDSVFVLRRPPRGSLAAGTHDVLREARILRRLGGAARVPRVLAVCDDAEVIGAPFFVMEYVDGVVIDDAVPAPLATPAARRGLGEELVDALLELGEVDWRACGFSFREGYLRRQLETFGVLWDRCHVRDVPAVERVGAWLFDHLPAEGTPTVVHGDYRLGNVVFSATAPPRIRSILDWEMATVGDPLADLGYLTSVWPEEGEPAAAGLDGLVGVLGEEGFPTREEILERYARRSGRPLDDLPWYRVLALWKAAVFMEGNYARARSQVGDDWHLGVYERSVPVLAEQAELICATANLGAGR